MRALLRKFKALFFLFYGQFNRPIKATIRTIVSKFCNKFTLLNIKPLTSLRRFRIEKDIAAVSASFNSQFNAVYGLVAPLDRTLNNFPIAL